MFNSISFRGTLRFAPWQWMPPMFSGIFLSFWPCGPSFPCILTLWAFISLHFGLVGLHFLAFWPCGPSFPFILAFSGSASGVPPTSCQKWPVCQTSLQWIYQCRDRLHFAVFSILGLHFLAFWPLWAFISLHFGLVGLHFLAFWPCGLSFPCILALWAFISFHFGLFGVGFWGPPTSCQKWPVCPMSLQWIYQRRDRPHFAVFSILGLHFLSFWPCRPSFPFILAFWAFISFHFGLVGLHFLAFWPCGHSFPFILAFSGSAFRVPPTSCQKWPVCPTSLQWIYQCRDRPHFAVFSILGLHFLAFWPCGPSFPCILALWAFISLHFGLVGLHFLSFWPFGPSSCMLALC